MGTKAGANPNMNRGEKTSGNMRRRVGRPAGRYVSTTQLLDAFDNKFGKPFAEYQMEVFHKFHELALEPTATQGDIRTFTQLFLHFSHKLSQSVPQQIEDVTEHAEMSREELLERAAELSESFRKTE